MAWWDKEEHEYGGGRYGYDAYDSYASSISSYDFSSFWRDTLTYADQFFLRKKVRKHLREKFPSLKPQPEIEFTSEKTASVDLGYRTINLPNYKDLPDDIQKTLAEHETLHIIHTKASAEIDMIHLPKSIREVGDYKKIFNVLNVIEDMYINKHLKREDIHKASDSLAELTGGVKQKIYINEYPHLNESEIKQMINGSRGIIFKKDEDEFSTETIAKRLATAIRMRKECNSQQEFWKYLKGAGSSLRQLLEIFLDPDPRVPWGFGDGPSDIYTTIKSDVELYKKVIKIMSHIKNETRVEERKKQFYGKRMNRKFFTDPAEIYPFKLKREIVRVDKPRVVLVLDASGSMEKFYGKLKAIGMAIKDVLQERANVVISEYSYRTYDASTSAIASSRTGGDEGFEFLPEEFKEKNVTGDVMVVITDMRISPTESYGLVRASQGFKKKYAIVVSGSMAEETKQIVGKEFAIAFARNGEGEEFLSILRKIVG